MQVHLDVEDDRGVVVTTENLNLDVGWLFDAVAYARTPWPLAVERRWREATHAGIKRLSSFWAAVRSPLPLPVALKLLLPRVSFRCRRFRCSHETVIELKVLLANEKLMFHSYLLWGHGRKGIVRLRMSRKNSAKQNCSSKRTVRFH
jgi:hypothetical protein